jgi:hypothetical protein
MSNAKTYTRIKETKRAVKITATGTYDLDGEVFEADESMVGYYAFIEGDSLLLAFIPHFERCYEPEFVPESQDAEGDGTTECQEADCCQSEPCRLGAPDLALEDALDEEIERRDQEGWEY